MRKSLVTHETVAAALQKLKPRNCGFQHHFRANHNGDVCCNSVRNSNPLCAHTEQTALTNAVRHCQRTGLITESQARTLQTLLSETQSEIWSFDTLEAATLETFLKGADELPEARDRHTVCLNEQLREAGSSLLIDEQVHRKSALEYAKAQQRRLGAPIEHTRRLLLILLEQAQELPAPEIWAQAYTNEFLARLSDTTNEHRTAVSSH